MNSKKLLAATLSLGIIFSTGANVLASGSETPADVTTKEEDTQGRNYLFNVIEIKDNEVTLRYNGEVTKNAIEFVTDDRDKTIKVPASLLPADVSVKDQYKLVSTKELKDIKAVDLSKENLVLDKKYEKPQNMDIKDIPKDAVAKEFVVQEVNNSDPVYQSAVVYEKDNEKSIFTINLDKLQDEDVEVGDTYKIYWDGISLESYPAQFGKIYRVEKTDMNQEDEKSEQTKMEFEVVEKSEDGVTLAEVANKDNLYNISLKDLRDDKPELGDRYMITWNGISMKSYPAQFGEIYDVEKLMKKDSDNISKDKLKEAIKKADKVLIGDASYSKESVEAFEKAYNEAKMVNDKEKASQEEIDKAANDLLAAINGLSEKTGEIKKEFQLTQFIEKGGKKAELQSVEYPDKKFTTSIDSLNDKDPKVGDHYMVTMSKVDSKAEPFEMGKITNIEKLATANTDKNDDKQNKKDNIVANKNKEETPKENKQTNVLNPKTGVTSVAPLLGVIAGGLALLKKKDK